MHATVNNQAERSSDEAMLIRQTLGGNQQAFAELMQRYTGAAYSLAYRMLGNSHDAEDAVQEIFLRAYTHLASYDQERRFSTWLLSIASNYCVDRLRRKRFAWLTLDDVAFTLPSRERGPESSALANESRAAVQRALLKLPENYRLVTVLRYWHDLSYAEIAQVTNLTESTIKTRLHRARHMLMQALGADETIVWDTETTTS